MIWKITGYIVLLTLLVLFITLNISNTSDISFIVYTAENVPVYVTIFISILLGCLTMGIVWILAARKNRKNTDSSSASQSGNSIEEKFKQNFEEESYLPPESVNNGSREKKQKGKKKQK